MNLEFFTFNNYYNRIIKKYNTIAEYELAVPSSNTAHYYDINFNPNDGVDTEVVVDTKNFSGDWVPDYLVVYDDTAQAAVAIQSRWFVIEWVRLRNGQYKATLHRDVIADNYDALINAPMYIEKATIQTTDDVAIYNKENLEVNQIKQNEELLKDRTEVPWLVGYFAKNINLTDSSKEDYVDPHMIIPQTDVDAIRVNTLADWDYKQYIDDGVHSFEYYRQAIDAKVRLNISLFPQFGYNNRGTISTDGSVSVSDYGYTNFAGSIIEMPTGGSAIRSAYLREHVLPDWLANAGNIVNQAITTSGFKTDNLKQKLNGQYLYVESGTDAGLYEIEVIEENSAVDTSFYAFNSNFEQYCNGLISDPKFMYKRYPNDDRANVQNNIIYIPYKIVLHSTTLGTASLTWPVNARKLQDAPYGMFCIPGNSISVKQGSTTTIGVSFNDQEAENIMCSIAEKLGGWCYDIQKLPYCPLNTISNSTTYIGNNAIKVGSLTQDLDYTYIYTNDNIKKGIILFPKFSSFSFNIVKALTIPRNVLIDGHEDTYVEDVKIANQCDFYRMYSPNWAASFEFSLAKTGETTLFNVDCTYKPYNPYIHMNPNWSKLYGKDYDDYRGLIVQGDFSIPRINDAWVNYQINNKNYLNAFNRQVESIELKNKVAGTMDVFNAITGSLTGAGAGAAAGAKLGPYGAAAGAIIGGTASMVGGALDVQYNEMLRNDALDLTKDQFNYNIQNIQALPDTLAKVSTFDKNNKIWPVLEYYSCTHQEKVAVLNKMIYNGMTIMRIGTLAEFLDVDRHYIKGQLIRCEGLADDFHILTAIADELNKGVFI